MVQVIREIANAIASLFGFEMTEVDYSGITAGASGAGDMADSLDEAAGAAKKLKQYTAGFDELNVFSPDSGSAGSGIGAGEAADLISSFLSMTSWVTLFPLELTRSGPRWSLLSLGSRTI